MVIFNKDVEVEANPGEGGGNDNNYNLNYTYMWKVTEEMSEVIYKAYSGNDIRKGRAFGTKGEEFAADLIRDEFTSLGLSDVTKKQMLPLDSKPLYFYTNKFVVDDYQLVVPYDQFPYDEISRNNTFPVPNTGKHEPGGKYDYKYWFNDTRIIPKDMYDNYWNFGGSFGDDSLNVPYTMVNDFWWIVGNTSYIGSNDSIPDEQDLTVFLIDEIQGCEDKLSNITNATAVVLLHDSYEVNTSNYNFTIVRVAHDDNNITEVKERLENGTWQLADNTSSSENITFMGDGPTFCWPNYDFVVIDRYPTVEEAEERGETIIKFFTHIGKHAALMWVRNTWHNHKCRGFIIYENEGRDVHRMPPVSKPWKPADTIFNTLIQIGLLFVPNLPMFYVNFTVGDFLEDNSGNPDVNITGSYLEQRWVREKHPLIGDWTPGVTAWNVWANYTIDKSPDDKIVIISNRYDGMWGETPGDSGAGVGMVLGIAEYFTKHNIKPKYNITFLEDTGEEIGFRGAQWYHDYLEEKGELDNVELWIGFDQLGMNQEGLPLAPQFGSPDKTDAVRNRDIVWAIANETGWDRDTDYQYGFKPITEQVATEMRVWQNDCNGICIVRDNASRRWRLWHTAGAEFSKGDVLDNKDRNALNETFELAWNITKYYCVNPDCSFVGDVTYEAIDSENDGDTLNDSIMATFPINTSMPHDKVMVKASLNRSSDDESVATACVNYTVTSAGGEGEITLSVPKSESAGYYYLYLELYNSTGIINDIVGISGNNVNDTNRSGDIHLYPLNDPPEINWTYQYMDHGGYYAGNVSEAITFDASNSMDDHGITNWTWDFDDGNMSYDENTTTHSYTVGDTIYEVTLTLTDIYNVSAEDTVNVYIDTPPNVNFIYSPQHPNKNQTVIFNSTSWDWDRDHPLNHSWDFGDGNTSYGPDVNHTYAEEGNYTVVLNVTDSDGCWDTATKWVHVGPIPPVASFYVETSYPTPGISIQFVDTSTDPDWNNIVSWNWSFGDGNYSENQNPTHTYSSSDIYSVSLTVTDNQSKSDTATKNVVVSDVWVDDDFTDDPGSHKWDTIQEGVNDSGGGKLVYVFNGTYPENVNLYSKWIYLVGECKESTIIDGNNDNVITGFPSPAELGAAYISNFMIRNGGYGIHMEDSGFNVISNCKIRSNSDGIYIKNSFDNNISDCIIYDNRDNGITIENGADGNTVENCIIGQNDDDGIYIYDSSGNWVAGCTIDGNDDNGIVLYQADGNHIGNLSSYPLLENECLVSIIGDCDMGIILESANENIIENFDIFGASKEVAGINLTDGSSGNGIYQCNLSGCGYGIWIENFCDENQLYHNNFIENEIENAWDNGSNVWDKDKEGGNYWDDYEGEDENEDGIGDTPYEIPPADNEDRYPLMAKYERS
jgi:parallel beta-helix repeat protein